MSVNLNTETFTPDENCEWEDKWEDKWTEDEYENNKWTEAEYERYWDEAERWADF